MTGTRHTDTRRGWEETFHAVPDDVRRRLADHVDEILADPAAVHRLFPAAARLIGRGPLDPGDPTGVFGPTLDDAVRIVLLESLAVARTEEPSLLVDDIASLYQQGDADEKRAVLRALPGLGLGDAALPLVRDALRTNDTRLVAAALGAYATEHLDAAGWRQGVLKCLFVGVPLAAVDGLERRADEQLASMVAAYAHERLAANRDVPPDAVRVLAAFPDVIEAAGLSDLLPAVE